MSIPLQSLTYLLLKTTPFVDRQERKQVVWKVLEKHALVNVYNFLKSYNDGRKKKTGCYL